MRMTHFSECTQVSCDWASLTVAAKWVQLWADSQECRFSWEQLTWLTASQFSVFRCDMRDFGPIDPAFPSAIPTKDKRTINKTNVGNARLFMAQGFPDDQHNQRVPINYSVIKFHLRWKIEPSWVDFNCNYTIIQDCLQTKKSPETTT